jgi:hypothetical protein
LQELLTLKKSELDELLNKETIENENNALPKEGEKKKNRDNDVENGSGTTENLKDEILNIEREIQSIFEEIKDYNLPDLIKGIEKKNNELNLSIKNEQTNNKSLREDFKNLKAVQSPTSTQLERITEFEGQIKKSDNIILTSKNKIEENKDMLVLLKESISAKYTNEKKAFIDFFHNELEDYLVSLLPKVVFWKYDEKYLQESVVNLEELLQHKDLSDIPRPLANIFRISFGISSLDDIKAKIREAQMDRNERSRISDQLTDNVNMFLKNIWVDYTQKIKITIEKDELRVAIFDPDKKDASYYSLIERSQGCRTFISFLLTIGAEANKKVLKNTILLLDEPETHLHPSGVKFMLKELIKISEIENNFVFFATHSIFMIDRDNFGRHIIIKKEKEISKLVYAYSNRIGNFMQEEVLYSALNVEFKEFDLAGVVNFVFEGYGDTVLFKNVYSNFSSKSIPFPLKDCVFHHGGGCENILKYLRQRPIKMKTKWIFILDSDKPADNLMKYIKSEYKDYLNSDVYVFQYEYNGIKNAELEDLLPDSLKIETFNNILSSEKKELIESVKYSSLVKDYPSFTEQYNEICKVNDLDGIKIKGLFKEMLNQALENKLKENISKEEFSSYYEWFEVILKTCKKNGNTQKESA